MSRPDVTDDVGAVLAPTVIDLDGVGDQVGPVGFCDGVATEAKPDPGNELLRFALYFEFEDEAEFADVLVHLDENVIKLFTAISYAFS